MSPTSASSRPVGCRGIPGEATVAGLIGNLSHWMAGNWVKSLGANAHSTRAYYPLYGQLALLLLLSLLGLPCLHAIRKREKPAPDVLPNTAGHAFRDPQFK